MGKYIVTGGLGFIGSTIVEKLLNFGHKVVIVDNLSTGFVSNILPTFWSNPNLVWLNLDIKDLGSNNQEFSAAWNADGIFHTAAEARIQPCVENPEMCHNVNVTGTLKILEFMRMSGTPKIVFSSSSSIYGLKNTNNLPLKEDYESDCLNPYSLSKHIGEQMIKTWCRLYGLSGVNLRYFNVYGPKEVLTAGQYSPVVGLFFQQALRDKKPMTVIGDGLQSRDMTHVTDVANANIYAMMDQYREWKGNIINIGTGSNVTVLKLAQSIQQLLKEKNIDSSYVHIPERPGEARETLASIEKAKRLLGWEPLVSFDEGLRAETEMYLAKYGY